MLLARADVLTFVLPVTFVAGYVLQLFIVINMLCANQFGCLTDDILRQAYLPCYLDGKRRTGLPDGQLEQRPECTSVVEHSAVDDAFRLFGEMLEVRVVRGDDTRRLCLVQAKQHTLRYSTADERLCTCTELVNQEQGILVGILDEVLHVPQVRRIGR